MLVKGRDEEVSIFGVRHGCRRDTSYVTSRIEFDCFNTGFVEKDPDVPLEEYGVQIRKIIGYLRKVNANIIDFDERLDYQFYKEETPNGFDEITYDQNRSREESVIRMRQRVKRQHPEVYKKIFLEREKRMTRNIDEWKDENELRNAVIVVGESHVPPIYNYINGSPFASNYNSSSTNADNKI